LTFEVFREYYVGEKKNSEQYMAKKTKQKGPFDYLFEWATPYKSLYVISVVTAVFSVIFGLIPFFCTGKIVAALIEGQSFTFSAYGVWLTVAACAWVLHYVCNAVSTTISHKATFSVIADVRAKTCDKLAEISMGDVMKRSSGELKNIIMERIDGIETPLAHMVPEISSKAIAPIAIFVFLAVVDWRIALISLVSVPIGLLCFMGMRIGYDKKFSRYVNAGKNLNSVAVEYINGIEVIKTFNQSANSYKKFTDAAYESAHSAIDWMRDSQFFFSFGMSIIPNVLVSVLPASVAFYLDGSLTLSNFVLILVLAFGMLTPLLSILSYRDDLARIGVVVGEINSILTEKKLERPETPVKLNDYTIKGNDVHFGYGEKEVLHGVDFTFEQGTVNALVGPSGSGKSTITKLIDSMWDVTGGSIEIGGVNVKDIPLKQLNEMIAYVSQDNFLFDETVRENIRKGNLAATDEDVENIAKASGCHDFIMSLENGYDTVVGSAGGHLSGGEKQRIAIARAMLKNAPIVILDEATAYADPENEAIVQESVSKLVKGKTLIVVAHRLSTIADSDKIVVVKDGNIVAQGKHEELLANCALYNDMWQAHVGAKDGLEK